MGGHSYLNHVFFLRALARKQFTFICNLLKWKENWRKIGDNNISATPTSLPAFLIYICLVETFATSEDVCLELLWVIGTWPGCSFAQSPLQVPVNPVLLYHVVKQYPEMMHRTFTKHIVLQGRVRNWEFYVIGKEVITLPAKIAAILSDTH